MRCFCNPIFVYFSEAYENINTVMFTSVFIAVLFTVAKMGMQPSAQQQMIGKRRMWPIYMIKYHLAIKSKQNFAILNKMKGA